MIYGCIWWYIYIDVHGGSDGVWCLVKGRTYLDIVFSNLIHPRLTKL
jgi:hypothetical protein